MRTFGLELPTSMPMFALLAAVACIGDKSGMGGQEGEPMDESMEGPHEGDVGGEADADGDADADTDADTDTDTDSDTDLPPPDDEVDGTDTASEDTGEVSCDAEGEITFFISPDDSNSTSSAAQARDAVLGYWTGLNAVSIRTYEFMNYYDFGYERPDAGEAIKVTTQMVRDPDAAAGAYDIQIGVASPVVTTASRAPMNITLILDTSGSMNGHSMNMLKAVSLEIAGELKEGDLVSAVVWDTSHAVLLNSHEVTGADDSTLMSLIESLESGGGTDLHGGLTAGYRRASAMYNPDRINRIVLISDGGANVGITDSATIAEYAGGAESDGIYMVGVGVGSSDTYNDDLMDDVTDAGKGASVFIASAAEAAKVFDDRFINTMDVAARNVSVALELPGGFEIVAFSGEEYSTDPAEIEPQHLAPNDAMVFLQTIQTCAPESVTGDTSLTVRVQYLDASTFESHEVRQTMTFSELLDGEVTLLRKGQAVFAYAEGLKAFQQASSVDEEAAALTDAFAALARAEAEFTGDADLAEIREVLAALE